MRRIGDSTRRWVALLMLGVLAILNWKSLDAGRTRDLVWVLLGGFGLRILLSPARSRYDGVVEQEVGQEKER
ncbi:MAG TPA: hypothetical protein VGD59_00435 [Acidisarcina sp.]